MRILAIQLNQPGDAILTTPVLRWLLSQGHEVHALVQPVAATLLNTMPGLGGVYPLPRGSFQIGRDLRRWRMLQSIGFDWAIVFSRCSERPALWARLSGAPLRSALLNENFPKLLRPLRWITEWRRYGTWPVHVVEQHLSLAGANPGVALNARLEYAPDDDARGWTESWLQRHGLPHGGYLHFHLTARWPSKCWPTGSVREFLQRAKKELPLPVVITTGPEDFEKQYAREALEPGACAAAEIGTLQPHQLGAMIEASGVFLGMDSMPMHLAAALQKPGVTLFGPTDPQQWGPWRAPITVLRPDGAEKKVAALSPSQVIDALRSPLAFKIAS